MEKEKIDKLLQEHMKGRRERAKKYFASLGINPDTKGNTYQERFLDAPPVPSGGMKNEPCIISAECFVFYTHVEVVMLQTAETFEGNCGGIGTPGGFYGAGDIYFNNMETLLRATTFGAFFGGVDGVEVAQITWGTSGNATAAGTGELDGAFGGSGNWYKTE